MYKVVLKEKELPNFVLWDGQGRAQLIEASLRLIVSWCFGDPVSDLEEGVAIP